MKILFVIDALSCGGKERRVVELMKSIKQDGSIDFELVVMNEDIHYKEVFDLGIRIHFLIRKTKKDLSVFSRLYKICKEYKPDIAHCWDSMTAIYCSLVCKRLGIKLVNSMVTDTQVKQNIFNSIWLRGKLTFPFSSIIIGNSLAGLRSYGAPAKKSICIYNGFNFERLAGIHDVTSLKNSFNGNGKYIIGMVAAFEPRKDYTSFVKAAIEILKKRSDSIFLLIGDGELKSSVMNIIPDEWKQNIFFTGRVNNVEDYVNMLDIGVLCTNSSLHLEGVSNSILEYMAAGKPVIATTGGGTNEIVDDGKTGFLIRNANTAELTGKIEMLLNDEQLRIDMGAAAKKRIKDHFSIDLMTKKYITSYKNLITPSDN